VNNLFQFAPNQWYYFFQSVDYTGSQYVFSVYDAYYMIPYANSGSFTATQTPFTASATLYIEGNPDINTTYQGCGLITQLLVGTIFSINAANFMGGITGTQC